MTMDNMDNRDAILAILFIGCLTWYSVAVFSHEHFNFWVLGPTILLAAAVWMKNYEWWVVKQKKFIFTAGGYGTVDGKLKPLGGGRFSVRLWVKRSMVGNNPKLRLLSGGLTGMFNVGDRLVEFIGYYDYLEDDLPDLLEGGYKYHGSISGYDYDDKEIFLKKKVLELRSIMTIYHNTFQTVDAYAKNLSKIRNDEVVEASQKIARIIEDAASAFEKYQPQFGPVPPTINTDSGAIK